ncbi:MAG: hypothetical protein WCT05_10440, partial [Lentisphaeria bacterium]
MSKQVFMACLLGFSLLLSGQKLTYNKILQDNRLTDVVLENEVLKISINERGGRLSSLYDKKQQIELCDTEDLTFSGLAKIRDILFNNIETITGRYSLELIDSNPDKLEVKASYLAQSGNLAGMQITRTYSLAANSAFLEGKVLVKCLEKEASFQLNLHNLFPIEALSKQDLK